MMAANGQSNELEAPKWTVTIRVTTGSFRKLRVVAQ